MIALRIALLSLWSLQTTDASSPDDDYDHTPQALVDRQNDEPNATIPSTPPWYYSESLGPGPDCIANSEACSGSANQTPSCIAEFCVESWFWGTSCLRYANLTDTSCLCQAANMTACLEACPSTSERRDALTWFNNTCYMTYPEWDGDMKPEGTLMPGDTPYYVAAPVDSAPGCAKHSLTCLGNANFTGSDAVDCSSSYLSLNSVWCLCDVVNMTGFLDDCADINGRRSILNWFVDTCMNSTIGPVGTWATELPSNWTEIMKLRLEETYPWDWYVAPSDPILLSQCPSTSGKLGAFAAVNVAMLLLSPIFGRRSVVRRITFGMLGQAHSGWWRVIGPFMAGLQIAVNFGNAMLIKRSPGFEQVDVRGLALLWLTRPRLAWIVIVLTPWGYDKALYFSCAASALLSEGLLQLMSMYIFGLVAHYGRKQGFYDASKNNDGRLDYVNKDSLLMMYAGALLWLIVVILAIIACFTAAVLVSNHMAAFRIWIGTRDLQITEQQQLAECQRMHREQSLALAEALAATTPQPRRIEGLQKQVESLHKLISLTDTMLDSLATHDKEYLKLTKEGKARPKLTPGESPATAAETDRVAQLRTLMTQIPNSLVEEANPWVAEAERWVAPEKDGFYSDRTCLEWREVHRAWGKASDRWRGIAAQRQEHFSQESQGREDERTQRRLTIIAFATTFGMFTCWLAQWIWWAGFVGTLGDLYCPPNLVTLATNWIVVSIVGIFLGASG